MISCCREEKGSILIACLTFEDDGKVDLDVEEVTPYK